MSVKNEINNLKKLNKEELINYFEKKTYYYTGFISEAEKLLKLKKGTYIKDKKTNLTYRIWYCYIKNNNEEIKNGINNRLMVKAGMPEVDLEVKNIEIISKKKFYSKKSIKPKLKNITKIIFNREFQISNLKKECNLYKKAYEILISGKKLLEYTCHHGPCLKGNLGQCDGECDYPGA